MRDFSRAASTLLALLPLTASGCCGIAAYFCGPDKSEWVSRDFRDPPAALATFLEALRRDHIETIYLCLSEPLKARHGLTGHVHATIAWERIKERAPSIHVLGSAQIEAQQVEPDGRVRFDLSVAGRRLQVHLRSQTFWEVAYAKSADASVERAGRFVEPRKFDKMLLIKTTDFDETVLSANIDDPILPKLTPGQLREVRLGVMWKVDAISGEGTQLQ